MRVTETMIDALETYLNATGQITSLAVRQARVLSRSVGDTGRADDARAVFLCALAALEKGVPRAEKEYLLAPLLEKNVKGWLGVLEKEQPRLSAPSAECAAAAGRISKVLDTLFIDPLRFAPLSGPAPASALEDWPLLVVDISSGLAGFSRYYKAAGNLENNLDVLLKAPLDKVKNEQNIKEALAAVFCGESILENGKNFHFRQVAAAALALRTKLLIVSGGPGTGKTSVVTQILRTLVRVFPDLQPDRIALCAPTGRAKAHLGEIVDREIANLEKRAADAGRSAHPRDNGLKNLQRKTVHGLLCIRPDNSAKYDNDNPLPYQVIVVDEASMVDVSLFSALIEAAAPDCRIILVGDMHQLPSVEAGAVLGDLTERFGGMDGYPTVTGETAGWIRKIMGKVPVEEKGDVDAIALSADGIKKAGLLADHTIILTRKYRSLAQSGEDKIARLSAFVNNGEWENALKLLAECTDGTVNLDDGTGGNTINKWLETHYAAAGDRLKKLERMDLDAAESQKVLDAAFEVLGRSRILTLVHEGQQGRNAINRQAGKFLRNKMDIAGRKEFFYGQPVIMTLNHHELDLYNGDTGLVVQEKNKGLKAVFCRGNRYVSFAIDRLTGLEPAFAMTVHKAQGSEFDEVLLVLPEYESPLLFRQIIYTGITRARSKVVILGSKEMLQRAIETLERRPGGVRLD
jgi:exodeoxyribonuclease V alpha subunit